MAGLEVETIEQLRESWEHIVVGRVLEVMPHPNADRLQVVMVDLGGERHQVECGAPNIAVAQKVAFAKPGARIVDAYSGEPTILKQTTIRGVTSAGMICSKKELGLADEPAGILVLSEDAPVGAGLAEHLGDTVLEIDMKPNRVGVLGQVQPPTASYFGVEQDGYLFEVVLDALVSLVTPIRRFEPLSPFPRVEEDLAVVVDRELSAARVRAELLKHPLVVSAEPFDEYIGEQVPEGKKSLAFAVSYQAPDRTLTDTEVAEAREDILAHLRETVRAELRR